MSKNKRGIKMTGFRKNIEVDVHDVDFNGVCRLSSLMRYIQSAAQMQLTENGMSYDELRERGVAFILSKIRLEFYSAVYAYDKLVARIAQLNVNAGDEIDAVAFDAGKKKFTDALDNDLNTSLAVTAVYDVFKLKTNDKTKLALIEDFEKVLTLGLVEAAAKIKEAEEKKKAEENAGVDPELLAYINEMIEARRTAKKEKNFAEADRIRGVLTEMGVEIKDTREGVVWQRI
jgi:cysteinyl-tRNA synthetase